MGKILIIKGTDFSAVSIEKVKLVPEKVNITVVASPNDGGTVTGSGVYDEGKIVIITATPNEHFIFSEWDDGDTNPTREITVGDRDKTYTASFHQIGVPLNILNDDAYIYPSPVLEGTPRNEWEVTPSGYKLFLLYYGILKNNKTYKVSGLKYSGYQTSSIILTDKNYNCLKDVNGINNNKETSDNPQPIEDVIIDTSEYAETELYIIVANNRNEECLPIINVAE